LRVVVALFYYFMGAFGPALVFWVLFIIFHWLARLLAVLYVNWYVCECIRDSAAGGIRAADTTATTPGLSEMLGSALKVLITAGVCTAPAIVYLGRTHNGDAMFWVLYGLGGFLFPMALLAVVTFDSLYSLNPLLLIGSILTAPFQYCALVVFCYGLCLLMPVAVVFLKEAWILAYLLFFAAFYQLLILAHLLGRFHWRNREKLNWDV